MEITKELLENILNAYSYEIVFVDRQHIVRYMNKVAKERYGNRVQINQSLFNCHNENSKVKIEEFLKRADAGEDPSLEVITIFFRTTFKSFLSICRFYRLFLYF